MKKQRKSLAYSIYCNSEDYMVIRRLQDKHSINISNAVRVFLKNKLEQLDKLASVNSPLL